MSCREGEPCREVRNRNVSFLALGTMALIFFGLSVLSFTESRDQVTPDTVSFTSYDAVQGKRVFQSYNCMGCHTILGNGGYLAPDLTNIYERAGPAWLAAFLPSAGTWPTAAAVRTQLQTLGEPVIGDDTSLEAYARAYPGMSPRVERRGGRATYMPNLQLSADEVGQLIAFLKYTSSMNTEGWPPEPQVNGLEFMHITTAPDTSLSAAAGTAVETVMPPEASVDVTARGRALAAEYACTSCHSITDERAIGPGWGRLYGSQVALADGSDVLADDAYLIESITQSNAKIVAGYTAGTMPSYAALLGDEEIKAIVAYIESLKGNGQ